MNEIKNVSAFKLEEAKFFLKKMQFEDTFDGLLKRIFDLIGNNAEPYSKTVEEFHFYFDAFLCAFRSITLTMKKELEPRVVGFGAWYEDIQKNLRDDDEMRLLHTIRNFTVHESVIPSSPAATINAHGGNVSCEILWYIGEDIKKEDEDVAKIPSIDDVLKRDIVSICTDCVDKMEKIVSDCERKFFRSV